MIIFMDLFSGPGLYKDKKHSTPLLVAKEIANDHNLKQNVQLMFNDNKYGNELQKNFLAFYPANTFNYEPRFADKTVGEDEDIENFLTRRYPLKNPHPTLLFFDPWGYKGIDTAVLAKFMLNWGNELFLFVNIKRINAAVVNGKFDDLMISLFPTNIDLIRQERRYKASVPERLNLIIDNLANEFEKLIPDKVYATAFKFQEEDNKMTSHYILHLTKHPKGYELIKQTYHEFDNVGADLEKDGTYTFDVKKMNYSGGLGFDFKDANQKALSSDLLKSFKGQEISARDLFLKHHVNNKFCSTHYSKTLRKMVEDGLISANFTDDKKHRKTVLLIDDCILKFK